MALKWNNQKEIDQAFEQLQAEYDRKAVIWLQSVGERVVKYAREHGNYTDRTGNLRNSIGYVVVQRGKVCYSSFTESEPQLNAREVAMNVVDGLPKGHKTFLVWVAGMEYAKYVEARGYDVIESSGNWVEATAERLKDEFRRYLKSDKR